MTDLKPKDSCILFHPARASDVNALELVKEDAPVMLSPELERSVGQNWASVKEHSPKAFNGILLNLKAIESKGVKILVSVNRTDYKTYAYLSKQPDYTLFNHRIAIIGTSCILLTGDNQLILASRGKGLVGEGNVYSIPGGFLNQKHASFHEQILVELQEELGIGSQEVSSIRFHGIGYDEVHAKGAEFLFSIRTPLTADQVIRRHAQAQDKAEADDLLAIDHAQIPAYVRENQPRIMRGSIANIITYLAHEGVQNALALEAKR